MSEVRPIRHPDGTALDWEDFETWFCFDCKERAHSYEHFDGYVRCLDCAAK